MRPNTAVRFATSGHTGPQRAWTRSQAQLWAEADLIGGLVIGEADEVVSFAPPWHIFGQLFAEVLPRLRGMPVQFLHDDPCAVPILRPGSRVLFVCLPASWLILRRLTPAIKTLGSAVLLHGTGPTTLATDRTLEELHGTPARAAELFGSTETGGVAYRTLTPYGDRAPWTLLPDVDLLDDPEGGCFGPGTQRLHVRSPRLARPEGTPKPPTSVLLDDVVQVLGDRQFLFLGRASRLLKINGRRCNLDDLEKWATSELGVAVACVPVQDPVRGEHYEMFCTLGNGAGSTTEVWRRLGRLGPTVPMPHRVHAVPTIPLTSTGKIKIDQLYRYAGLADDEGGGR